MTGAAAHPARWAAAALAAVALIGAAGAAGAGDGSAPPRLGACGAEAGGFRLPGTDGCLRIDGFVAAEGAWSLQGPAIALSRAGPVRPTAGPGADLSRSGLGVDTRLSADLRVPTDAGPVRVFVSVRGRNGAVTDRAAR